MRITSRKIRAIFRKAFSPITIMLIPHSHVHRSLNISVPLALVCLTLTLSGVGSIYLVSIIADAIRYQSMGRQIRDYSSSIEDFRSTLLSLKKTEKDLKSLLSQGSREKVLEKVDLSADTGTFDIESIQKQIDHSVQTVSSIREFLKEQKDLYVSTPTGFPVEGPITSPYGQRVNPITGQAEFHRGMDISCPVGAPVRATADGIVTFSGWSSGGGNVVVVEHGHGYATYYAHNSKTLVEVGQRVKRGNILAHAGATGSATGNHVHYEILKNGVTTNPINLF